MGVVILVGVCLVALTIELIRVIELWLSLNSGPL